VSTEIEQLKSENAELLHALKHLLHTYEHLAMHVCATGSMYSNPLAVIEAKKVIAKTDRQID
jgi:hypothetical protein